MNGVKKEEKLSKRNEKKNQKRKRKWQEYNGYRSIRLNIKCFKIHWNL